MEVKLSNMYKPNSYWPINWIRLFDNTHFPELRMIIWFTIRLCPSATSAMIYDAQTENRKELLE